MKNAAVKLVVLNLNINYDNVGKSTGVDMHAHKVASHEIVLPRVQNGSSKVADLVADLGQLKVDQVERSTKLTAGDVPEKGKAHKQVKPAGEATVHV